MKTRKQSLVRALLLFGAAALMAPAGVMAANNYTPACTPISNTAKITYTVAGVDPTGGSGLTSTAAQFNVGVKVDFSLARVEGAAVAVDPGAAAQLLNFTLTNNGNATMQFALTSAAQATTTANPFGGALNDTFDGTSLNTNGTAGATATLATLAPDANSNLTISITVPNGPQGQDVAGSTAGITYVDRALAAYLLTAKAQWVGSGADVGNTDGTIAGTAIGGATCIALGATTVDYVVADPANSADDVARDGLATMRHAYQVKSAQISIAKSSAVLTDPVNCTIPGDGTSCIGGNSATARMIPGAVVEYTITVSNAGGSGSSATLNSISDLLPNSLKIIAAGASWSVAGSTRGAASGALVADTGDANTDGLGHSDTTAVGGTVTANLATIIAAEAGPPAYAAGELKTGEAVTVKFRATIQ